MDENLKKYPIAEYCVYNNLNIREFEILDSILNYPNGALDNLGWIWDEIDILKEEQKQYLKDEKDITLNSIPHYYIANKDKDMPEQFSEVIKFVVYYKLDFSQGSVLKYMSRSKSKGLSVLDLEKIKFYSDVIVNGNYNSYKEYKERVEGNK